jgi:hypothetical protein
VRAAKNEKEKPDDEGGVLKKKEEKRFLEFVACLHVLCVCVDSLFKVWNRVTVC